VAVTLPDTLSALVDDVDGEMRPLSSKMFEHESGMGKISRRVMMRILVTYGALVETGSAHAATKFAQTIAGYQSKPMGAAQCSNCKNFEGPSSCKIVEGVIAPTGWCRLYAQRK
jgi:hypothetical protein